MAGLWHDLGKFLDEFQVYLEKSADGDSVVRGSVDHAIVGARYAVDTLFPADLSPISDLFAYVIAGHHSGLPDGDSLFNIRLLKEIGEWKSHAPASLLEPGILAKSWLEAIQRICPERKGGILASEHKRRNERQNKYQHSFHHKHLLISVEIDLAYAIYLP